jgi:cytochrome P450
VIDDSPSRSPAAGSREDRVVADLPSVEPMPPQVGGPVPWLAGGTGLLVNPTAFFGRQRGRHGDTFVVDAFGHRLFCVFSAAGTRALYELPEDQASFGLATYTLIKAKVPLELLLGRRNHPKNLFGSQKVETYLDHLHQAVDLEVDQLGASGRFEVFTEMRRLGHRLGLAAWAGEEAASARYLDRLIPLFDRLDSSESFVRPDRNAVTWATRKRSERAAIAGIEAILAEIWAERKTKPPAGDFLDQIYDSYADLPAGERVLNAARDVIVIHMGSQSNLYAALAWTLANLLLHPDLLERVRAGDDELLEQCANESIRMAQRSITLRQVVKPMTFTVADQAYDLAPGVLVTTMLSNTNTTAGPDLDRFDPAHYRGRRLAPDVSVPTKELVSTFGHGSHSCPAARFSISAIRISIRGLLDHYDLTPSFTSVAPRSRQIGGVARAAKPCWCDYRAR